MSTGSSLFYSPTASPPPPATGFFALRASHFSRRSSALQPAAAASRSETFHRARYGLTSPDAGWTWHATEGSPEGNDFVFFGYVQGIEAEWGNFSLSDSARAAADYKGAMVAGGRWNPIGTPMPYTAQHLSLACAEVLVHLDKSQLPRSYVRSNTGLPAAPPLLAFESLSDVGSRQAAGHVWVSTASQLSRPSPLCHRSRGVQRPVESSARRV